MRWVWGVALSAAASFALWSADQPEPRWVALNRAAHTALEAKDYLKLRDALAELRPLLPGNRGYCTSWRWRRRTWARPQRPSRS